MGQIFTDMQGGMLSIAFVDAVSSLPLIKAGKIIPIGITGTLASHGVGPQHLQRLVAIATADGCHQTNPRPCSAADFERLFQAAM
jgi:hypothetical protein